MNSNFRFQKGLIGSDILENMQALGEPKAMTEFGCFRKGDRVMCNIRRCESGGKEGEEIKEPRIEAIEGVLDRHSMSSPCWWVKTEQGLRLVWDDELVKL